MTKHAAIEASYADFKLVRTRGVAQIVAEIPLEKAAEFIAAFGIPDPAKEAPIAIARLNGKPEPEKTAVAQEHRRMADLKETMQAGILCADAKFQAFLREQYGRAIKDEEDAAVFVRAFCGVDSRSGLNNNHDAAARWSTLRDKYQAWNAAQ